MMQSWEAMALAEAGEIDAAFEALESALALNYRDVGALRRGRWFVPLRREPRFEELMERFHIPAA